MFFGLCMSSIDHDRNSRSDARKIALDLKKEYGLNSIELVLEGIGRRFAPYPWEWTGSEFEETEKFLSNFERKGAHLPFYAMNTIAVNERVRDEAMEQMRVAVDVARKLNLDYAVVHATGTTEGLLTDREPRRHSLALRRIAEYCQGSNLVLAIENAQGLFDIPSCLETIRTLKADGLPVAMTFDTGHANVRKPETDSSPLEELGGITKTIESCLDLITNIHLHNNHGQADQHLGLENGSMDLQSFIKTLKDLGYTGSLSLETSPEKVDSVKELTLLRSWLD